MGLLLLLLSDWRMVVSRGVKMGSWNIRGRGWYFWPVVWGREERVLVLG